MRLRAKFGAVDEKETGWWRAIDEFPQLIKFLGRNWEWVFYEKDPAGKVDMVLVYAELPSYDPNYNANCPTWSDLFGDNAADCDCGAKYSSFEWDHMRFCQKWTKW